MKPIVLLLVCLLAGSAAGYVIAVQDNSVPNDFGILTNSELSWKEIRNDANAPKAVVEGGSVFAFGRMELNSVGKHTFVVKNEGKSPLELTMEGTTCKCTMADLKEGDVLEVPPGETTEINLEWRPKAYQDSFGQTATISTNDPSQPTLELKITGSVVQAVVIEPNEVRFANLAAGESRSVALKVLSYKEPSFELMDLQVTGEGADHFSTKSRPMTAEELKDSEGSVAGYMVELEVAPGLPLGTNRNKLIAKTSSEFAPDLEISITSYVVGDITVIAIKKYDKNKGVLYLGKLKQDQSLSTKLFLLVKGPDRDNVKLALKSVRPEYLQVEIGEPESLSSGNVRKFPVSLEVPKGSPPGNYLGPDREKLGKISFSVEGHSEIKEVDIGLYFSVE